MSEKHLLTAGETATMLTIARSTLWANVKKGLLPQPVKIGGATRWRRADLLPLVQATPTTTP